MCVWCESGAGVEHVQYMNWYLTTLQQMFGGKYYRLNKTIANFDMHLGSYPEEFQLNKPLCI